MDRNTGAPASAIGIMNSSRPVNTPSRCFAVIVPVGGEGTEPYARARDAPSAEEVAREPADPTTAPASPTFHDVSGLVDIGFDLTYATTTETTRDSRDCPAASGN